MAESSLNKYLLKKEDTIRSCIEKINKNGLGFCVILDKNKKVFGIITDGDLRRGLLKISNINQNILSIINKKYFYLDENNAYKSKKVFYENTDIKFIPIIDKKKQLVNILFKDQNINFHDIPVVIMAGGKGKRLRPITNKIPKPMIKIGNKPIIEIIINKLKKQSFKNIFVSVNYQKDVIKNYFRKNKISDMNINFIEESKSLGTLGSLSLFYKKYNFKGPLLVLNSDLYTNFNFRELIDYHTKSKSKFTVVVRQYEVNIPYGLMEIKKNKIVNIFEKPVINNHVNSGIYVIDNQLKKYFKTAKKLDANEFINKIIKSKYSINPFFMHEFWLDIGNYEDLDKARSLNV